METYTYEKLSAVSMHFCNVVFIPKPVREIELLLTLTRNELIQLKSDIGRNLMATTNQDNLPELPAGADAVVRANWGPLVYIKVISEGDMPEIVEYKKYVQNEIFIYDLETGEKINTTMQMRTLLLSNWEPVKYQLLHPPQELQVDKDGTLQTAKIIKM